MKEDAMDGNIEVCLLPSYKLGALCSTREILRNSCASRNRTLSWAGNLTHCALAIFMWLSLCSCTYKFDFDEVCFNFKLCTLDDAIRYEEFIGSELVEDSIFYSHIIGGKDETRVYKREKSGCGLPLYVKYQVWQKSDHHLWQIEYFWGPYAGLADDSTYVVNAMYNHFLKNPYAYKRLCEEFTGLIVEINDKIEMYDVNDLESIHSNSFAYIDWGLGQEGLNKKDSLLVINNLTLCQESVNSAETYCLEDAYGYLRGFFACRYNPEWNDTYLEMSLYVKETVPLIPIEGMPYGFMRLTFVPGISDKERYSHEVQEH